MREGQEKKKENNFLFNVQEFTLGGPKHLFLMVAALPAPRVRVLVIYKTHMG